MRTILTFVIAFLPLLSFSQIRTTDDTWQDIYNALSDLDDYDEGGWSEAYEIFTSLAQSPQNINDATITDLLQVPLLSEQQALAIINYRTLYGDIHSMSEIYLIKALDRPRILLLQAVFYAAPATPHADGTTSIIPIAASDSIRQLRKRYSPYGGEDVPHSVLFSMNIPTYERRGYQDGTYHGYNVSHSLRYRYQAKRLQVGFTASQDAGEPFFAGTNKKGWDFYTGFAQLKKTGIIQNLVVGHYQMSLGMGLLMNTDYRLSRTSLLLTSPNTSATLRGHSSRQQSNYQQGAAGTLVFPIRGKMKFVAITPFISYRAIDASLSNGLPQTITTIRTDGYHRTDSEILRRNNAYQFTAGTSFALNIVPFRVALNVLHTSLSDSIIPDKGRIYNRYRPTGKSFTSGSLSYSYVHPRFQVAGETAVSGAADSISYVASSETSNGVAFATINSIRYKLSDYWSAFALQRFYSYRYQSLLGMSFGDMSNCQNETGFYVGASTTIIPHVSLSAYVDCAYHPWARYGYKDASRSFDAYLLATYTRKAATATVRYRYREMALAPDGNAMPAFGGSINGSSQHTLRFTLKHALKRWTSISQAQGTYLPTSSDWGFLVSEAVGYKILGSKQRRNSITTSPLSLWCSLTYFNTTDYVSRLYLTDRNMAYDSTLAMLFGRGIRANIMLQSAFTTHLSAAIRCNSLNYFDRSQISSSHQLIESSHQTDISLQLQITL